MVINLPNPLLGDHMEATFGTQDIRYMTIDTIQSLEEDYGN